VNDDEIAASVQASKKQRHANDPRYLKALEDAKAFVAQQDAAEAAKVSAEAERARVASMASKAEVKDAPGGDPRNSPGFLVEGGRAIAGGMRDAGQEVIDLIDEAATWLDNNFINLRMFDGKGNFGKMGAEAQGTADLVLKDTLPTVEKNQHVAGQVGRGLTQFLAPFAIAMRALKGVYAGSRILKPLAVGAAVDFAAFDPHEKRLANLIDEHLPWARNPITEYLKANKDDTWLEGRLKNAGEGGILGVAAEGVFKLVKAYAKHLKGSGRELPPAEKVEPSMPAQAETPLLPSPDKTADGAIKAGAPGDDHLGTLIERRISEQRELDEALQRSTVREAERAAEDARVTQAMAADGRNRDGTLIKAVEENVDDVASRGYRTPNSDAGDEMLEAGIRTSVNEDGVMRIDVDGVAPPPKQMMPEPWEIDGGFAPRVEPEVDRVLQDFVTGTPRRAWVDPDNGVITASRTRPEGPSVIDMDRRVEEAMTRSPVERTAEDLIMLRAYKQMQEKALEAFKGRFTVETPSAPKLDAATRREALTPLTIVRDKPKALTDAQRTAIREQGEEMMSAIAKNAEQMKRVDEKIALLSNRGRNQRFTPKGESGFMSPSLLMNLGAGAAGAVTGLATADDDLSFGERMARAGLFAAAGMGIKVGAGKLLDDIRGEKAEKARVTEEVVKSLARPEMAGIRPKPAVQRVEPGSPSPTVKRPAFPKALVTRAMDAFTSGDDAALAKAIDESDFNFANLDSSADIKKTVDAFSNIFEKQIGEAKRGVRTLKEQEEFARELGVGIKSLKEQYEAMGFAAERAVAHRAFLMASAQKTRQMAEIAVNPPPNVDKLDAILAFRKQVAAHAEIQAYMKGIQTEAGRMLGSFRIQSTAAQFKADELEFLLTSLGGISANVRWAQQLADIADPAKLNAVTRKGAVARTADALFESVVNGLLSGPRTFVVNTLGNSMIPFVNATEKAIAAGVGAVRGAAKGDRYVLREAEISLRGFVEGAWDSLRINGEGRGELAHAAALFAKGDIKGAEAIITGSEDLGPAIKSLFNKRAYADSADASTAEAMGNRASITAGNFGLRSETTLGAVVDYAGAITRTPGRMLMATDELFKGGHMRGELRSLAYRKALAEGLTGDAFTLRAQDLLENPTPAMREQALRAARDGTFTNDLGSIGSALQKLVLVTPGLRYIMPFVKTPINILNYVGERTPLINAYSKKVRDDWAAGGARRDMVIARSALGGILYATAYNLKTSGVITGGGDENQQAEKLGAKMPYSIKVGDTWYAYNRMDPVGMFFGLAADIADISGNVSASEMDEVVGMAILAMNRNIVSKSYLKGIVDTMNVVGDPERYSQSFINRFAAMLVPFTSALATATTEVDPFIKEAWDVTDAIKARIPGLSKTVPNHVNLLGEDVKFLDGWGPDFASPIKQMQDKPISPLAQEIGDLDVDIKHPGRSLVVVRGAPPVDLTPQQYHRLMKITGAKFKELGEQLVTSSGYKSLPSVPSDVDPDYMGGKEAMIRKVWVASMEYGRRTLISEDKSLAEKMHQTKLNKMRVFMGQKPVPINN
jgi:hypothetical protein